MTFGGGRDSHGSVGDVDQLSFTPTGHPYRVQMKTEPHAHPSELGFHTVENGTMRPLRGVNSYSSVSRPSYDTWIF